jgi:uncharacterized protein YpmS
MNFDTKNLTRRATEIALAIWAFKYPILVAVVAGLVLYFVLGIQKACLWSDVVEHLNKAGEHGANTENLEGDRKQINENINAGSAAYQNEQNQINANIIQTNSELNNLNNRPRGRVNGSSLDADADAYRKRPGRANRNN